MISHEGILKEALGALVFAALTVLDVGDVLISKLGGYWENLSFEE
jgi:hypothetical protein